MSKLISKVKTDSAVHAENGNTSELLSWSAIQFIQRPSNSWYFLASLGLLLLFVGSFAIASYRKILISVSTRGEITTSTAPKLALASQPGWLQKLLHQPGDLVSKNEVLAIIANAPDETMRPIAEYPNQQLLRSPTDGVIGKIALQENTKVASDQEIVSIVTETPEFIALLKVSANQLAPLQINQKVFYRLDAFPSRRVGVLEGKILSLDKISGEDKKFLIRASIDSSPLTNLNKTLSLVPGMTLNAEIITGSQTFWDAILEKIF